MPGFEEFNTGCGNIAQLHVFFHPGGICIIFVPGQVAVHQLHKDLLSQGTVLHTNQISVPNRQSAEIPIDICNRIPEFVGLFVLDDAVDFMNQIPQQFLLQCLNGIVVRIEGFPVDTRKSQ